MTTHTITENPASFLNVGDPKTVEIDLADQFAPAEYRRRRLERQVRHHLVTALRQLRRASGLTQTETGDVWGNVNQGQVSRFEHDPGNARAATLISYLDALGGETEIRMRVKDQRLTIRVVDGHVTVESDNEDGTFAAAGSAGRFADTGMAARLLEDRRNEPR